MLDQNVVMTVILVFWPETSAIQYGNHKEGKMMQIRAQVKLINQWVYSHYWWPWWEAGVTDVSIDLSPQQSVTSSLTTAHWWRDPMGTNP